MMVETFEHRSSRSSAAVTWRALGLLRLERACELLELGDEPGVMWDQLGLPLEGYNAVSLYGRAVGVYRSDDYVHLYPARLLVYNGRTYADGYRWYGGRWGKNLDASLSAIERRALPDDEWRVYERMVESECIRQGIIRPLLR